MDASCRLVLRGSSVKDRGPESHILFVTWKKYRRRCPFDFDIWRVQVGSSSNSVPTGDSTGREVGEWGSEAGVSLLRNFDITCQCRVVFVNKWRLISSDSFLASTDVLVVFIRTETGKSVGISTVTEGAFPPQLHDANG
jgi:hypothetical protein